VGPSGPVIIFIGFNITFFPQFILGYLGMVWIVHYPLIYLVGRGP
jgi:hypothetical protein